MTNAGLVLDETLQKLIDSVLACIRLPNGELPDEAPNAWKDRLGGQINADDTAEFELVIRTNPDGMTAFASVRPLGSMARSISGEIDISLLAEKLV